MARSRFRLSVQRLVLGLALVSTACERPAPDATASAPPLAGAAIGGDFTLVDKAGKTVRYGDFAGRYRIVYFGYTFCPDACPQDVQTLVLGFNAFAKAEPGLAAQVQPIFVTIDPARDTPAVVGEFAAAFSPRLLGLTGTPAQVGAAASAFKVYHAKGEALPDGGYLMDHSRIAYLMDRDGKPLAMLPVDKGPQAVAAELAKWTS
ncbi:MAG TPA: SCO family protein [Novosphingobium sp.]|nr:SCO family protein [Novosphingobium sp.]